MDIELRIFVLKKTSFYSHKVNKLCMCDVEGSPLMVVVIGSCIPVQLCDHIDHILTRKMQFIILIFSYIYFHDV